MKLALLLSALLLSGSAFAQSSDDPPIDIPFHLDLTAFTGYSSAAGVTTPPTMLQFGGGATVALRYGAFILGITGDARSIGQMSELDPIAGSFTGTRMGIYPVLGLRFLNWILKGEYQFTGDYALSGTTTSGASIRCISPQGFRATVLYRIVGRIFLGLDYERVSYSQINYSSTGTFPRSEPLVLWQSGLTAALVF